MMRLARVPSLVLKTPSRALSNLVEVWMHAQATASLRRVFVDLLTDVCGADWYEYEETDAATVRRELVPRFREWAERAISILGCLEEAPELDAGWTELQDLPAEEIAPLRDRAYVLCSELRSCAAALARLQEGGEVWALLAQGERLREQLVQGLRALEQELCRLDGEPSKLGAFDPLPTSLLVRRVTTEFRRAMNRLLAQADEDDPVPTLRSATNLLTRLIGRPDFRNLRVLDRVAATQLRKRLVSWLRAPGHEPDEGRHLHQELAAYAMLLGDVNQREELVAHDRAVLQQALAPETSAEDVEIVVQPLYGRDESLDQLLLEGAPATRITARLIRVFNRLAGPLA